MIYKFIFFDFVISIHTLRWSKFVWKITSKIIFDIQPLLFHHTHHQNSLNEIKAECGRITPIYPFVHKIEVFMSWSNKKILYLSIWANKGGARKGGRGPPIFGFQLLLYCLMIPPKFQHCSFFRFIFMTYYVLKCSKMVDFYGFFCP